MRDDFVTALDLGTSKTCVLLGKKGEKNKPEIIGLGFIPDSGLKKGIVADMKKTIGTIEKAVAQAEKLRNCTVHALFANVGGAHVKKINSQGSVKISNKNNQILKENVENSIRRARDSAVTTDGKIVTTIPQEYIVDGGKGIKKPEGMIGQKLKANVLLVAGKKNSIENVEQSISQAGFDLEDIYSGALASSEAVLTEAEKEIGVFLLDIGAGTTDTLIYLQGMIKGLDTLPVGGKHITNDLAIGLRVPIAESERLKKEYGWCLESLITDHKQEIPTTDSTGKVSKTNFTALAEIIEPRMEEIFLLTKKILDRSGYSKLIGAGVVITGGTSLLKGIKELGEKIFKMPVRIGVPENFIGFENRIYSPIFSTAVGLLRYGLKKREEIGGLSRFPQNNRMVKLYKKLRRKFNDFF